jgi:hypothetical protein
MGVGFYIFGLSDWPNKSINILEVSLQYLENGPIPAHAGLVKQINNYFLRWP